MAGLFGFSFRFLLLGIALTLWLTFLAAVVLGVVIGEKGVGLVFLFWFSAFSYVFIIPNAFDTQVDHAGIVERSGLFGCEHIVLELSETARDTPFAAAGEAFDWQIERPDVLMSQGGEAWTPTPAEAPEELLRQMAECGLSEPTTARASAALAAPGSWLAFKRAGRDQVYFYSAPESLAMVFATKR